MEATGGNTGVAMALLCAARGYRAVFTVPAGISQDKIDIMRVLGAEVVVCPLVPFTDERNCAVVAARAVPCECARVTRVRACVRA